MSKYGVNEYGVIKYGRFVSSVLAGLLLALSMTTAVAAQGYGDDPPERVQVGSGEADFDGKFAFRYTAPDSIAEPYLIYVVGTDEDGEPFEWIAAQVTPAFAGLSWTLQGANMQPGSSYILEARYPTGAEPGAEPEEAVTDAATDEAATDVLGSQQGTDDGSKTGVIVGGAILLAVLGGAGVYGLRMRSRHA